MIVVIQGSKAFGDYSIFLAGMRSALVNRQEDDPEFTVYSAGPMNVNNMAMEFINVTERSLKAKGIKSKLIKIPPSWINENKGSIDYLAYFCNPKEPVPPTIESLGKKEVNVQVFRY
jgi:hypothetical protein